MSQEEKPYNAGDEAQVKDRVKKSKLRELQRKEGLGRIMDSLEGRMWMWALLEVCGIYHTSFSENALTMAFAEGRRDIGLRIVADIIKISPAQYARMVEENQNRRAGEQEGR